MELIEFGLNQSVAQALDSYLNTNNPRFAALIHGKWGCGKTWFAKKFIEYARDKHNTRKNVAQDCAVEDTTFCYVSLFDICDCKEIDAHIIQCMNPILFGKGTQTFGRIGRFVIEKALRFAPVGISGEDIEKGAGIFLDLFRNRPKNLVVIFDDLERTKIPMNLVLGYASVLLEDGNTKVVLVCNDEKMKDDADSIFKEFNEKVVGMRLSILADIKSSFDSYLSMVDDRDTCQYFNDFYFIFKDIYSKNIIKNLRQMRKVLFLINVVYSMVANSSDDVNNNPILKNKEYMSAFIKNLFAIQYAIDSGKIKPSEVCIQFAPEHEYCDFDNALTSIEFEKKINNIPEIKHFFSIGDYCNLSLMIYFLVNRCCVEYDVILSSIIQKGSIISTEKGSTVSEKNTRKVLLSERYSWFA